MNSLPSTAGQSRSSLCQAITGGWKLQLEFIYTILRRKQGATKTISVAKLETILDEASTVEETFTWSITDCWKNTVLLEGSAVKSTGNPFMTLGFGGGISALFLGGLTFNKFSGHWGCRYIFILCLRQSLDENRLQIQKIVGDGNWGLRRTLLYLYSLHPFHTSHFISTTWWSKWL